MGSDTLSLAITEEQAGKALFKAVAQVRDNAIFLLDAQGRIVQWDAAAEIMKGYSGHEIIGSYFGILYPDEARSQGRPAVNLAAAAMRGNYQEEAWRRHKDGTLFWALVELIALKGDDGAVTGYCKITRDITKRKEMQDQLEAERERAEVTLAAVGEAVVSVDGEGKVNYLNAEAERLTGWRCADARGLPLPVVFKVAVEADSHPRAIRLLERLRRGQPSAPVPTAVLTRKDGATCPIEDTAAPIRLKDGRLVGGVIVFRDVTHARRLLEAATAKASHDALTGLLNRAEFERNLQRSLDRARRSGATGAVLFMDLDQFKLINDSCSHAAGDQVLTQIAGLYHAEIRERDILARLGGDEFALLADHCTKAEATSIAEKILQSTRAYQYADGERVFSVGVSIGLALFDGSTQQAQDIINLADCACYMAKQNGRNQIVEASMNDANAAARQTDLDWIRRLTDGMHSKQLELHGQPIAAADRQSRHLNCEILLRLVDAQQGTVLPGVFLSAAKRYDLMPTLDRWVIDHVLQWLGQHGQFADQLDWCAINLSLKTMADDAFLGDLTSLLAKAGIAPGKLCFEIAGAAAITDVRKSVARMAGLRELGCKVSLGGVGAGMISFAHLKQFPVDFIKLDASAAAAITHSALNEKIIVFTNEIAKLVGQKTIAECVEDQATSDALARIGVDFVQGRWIAPPARLDYLSGLLAH